MDKETHAGPPIAQNSHQMPHQDASLNAHVHSQSQRGSISSISSHNSLVPPHNYRNSASVSILSNLWSSTTSAVTSPNPSSTNHLDSSTAAHRASALRQLTSDPSTSAALLTRLRQHRPAKSTSSDTTLSSQPVIVRTYSGHRNRRSRPASTSTAASMGLGTRHDPNAKLPPVEDFTFDGILRAVEPEIRTAIDAIAEICARSRMSLADEYSAHLPPQGEITVRESQHQLHSRPTSQASSTTSGSSWGWGYARGLGFGLRPSGMARYAAETQLTAVPEASSSSERLSGDSRSGSPNRPKKANTAVGSLRSIMSGEKKHRNKGGDVAGDIPNGKAKSEGGRVETDVEAKSMPETRLSWQVLDSHKHPEIALMATPTTSKALTLDTSTDFDNAVCMGARRASEALQRQLADATEDTKDQPYARQRARSITLGSWMPWRSQSMASTSPASAETAKALSAEASLKDLLRAASSSQGRPMSGFG